MGINPKSNLNIIPLFPCLDAIISLNTEVAPENKDNPIPIETPIGPPIADEIAPVTPDTIETTERVVKMLFTSELFKCHVCTPHHHDEYALFIKKTLYLSFVFVHSELLSKSFINSNDFCISLLLKFSNILFLS